MNCFIDSLLKRLSYFKKSVEHCVVIPAITWLASKFLVQLQMRESWFYFLTRRNPYFRSIMLINMIFEIFLTASWSGGTLPLKDCGWLAFSLEWKPRKFKLPGWLYEQFSRSHHEPLLSLKNSLKMYHVSILIVKRARNLKTIPASWPTDVAILLNWLTTWY